MASSGSERKTPVSTRPMTTSSPSTWRLKGKTATFISFVYMLHPYDMTRQDRWAVASPPVLRPLLALADPAARIPPRAITRRLTAATTVIQRGGGLQGLDFTHGEFLHLLSPPFVPRFATWER